jgi:uncharacterized protein YoxC
MAFLFLSPFAAYAAGATVTVKTDQASYSGVQTLTIFGTVSPAPTAVGTNIVITVRNQLTHATVITSEATVNTDGSYTTGFVTGGSSNWTSGTYVVNGTYVSGTTSGSGTATFTYSSTSQNQGGGISQAQYNNIIGNITALSNKVDALSGTVAGLQSGQSSQGTQIGSIASSLNALTNTVNGIQGTLTSVSNSVTQVNTAVGQVSSQFQSISAPLAAAGQTQTYVLVVAVLTAITLVLVLAVLVRRLS